MDKSIILTGFMGAGKTTVGRVLAAMTSLPLIDTDSYIESMAGMSVSAIFAQYGETYFRDLETAAVSELISQKQSCIVSCGGGLVLRPENRILLKKLGTVIYLQVSPKTVALRLSGDTTRPLLSGADADEKIRTLMASRQNAYEAAADLAVCADEAKPEEICAKILREIEKST